jgi:hypothetical protein
MSAMAEVLRSPLAARAMFGGRPKGDAVTLTARQTRSEVRSTEQVVHESTRSMLLADNRILTTSGKRDIIFSPNYERGT